MRKRHTSIPTRQRNLPKAIFFGRFFIENSLMDNLVLAVLIDME